MLIERPLDIQRQTLKHKLWKFSNDEHLLQVWSSLLIYRNILDAIEENDYDNLTKRAYVGRAKKLLMLPLAYTKSHSLISQ